jgi:hypothetical protein
MRCIRLFINQQKGNEMVASIVGLLASIIGGAVSSSANKDYQAELQEQMDRQRVSESMNRAEQIYAEQATQGLPYYEQQKADIETSIPTTLNQARDYMSGGGLVDALTSIYTNTQGQKRQLDAANAQQRMANQQAYGQFLGQVKAPAEQRVSDIQTELALQKAGADVTRKQDMLAFANEGAQNLEPTGLLNILGTGDYSSILSQLLAGGNSGGGLTGGTEFAPSVPQTAPLVDDMASMPLGGSQLQRMETMPISTPKQQLGIRYQPISTMQPKAASPNMNFGYNIAPSIHGYSGFQYVNSGQDPNEIDYNNLLKSLMQGYY